MNRIKYRICLVVLLVAAIAAGVLYYVYGQEKEEPYSGASLVWQEESWGRELS